jgi:hypothetical protein
LLFLGRVRLPLLDERRLLFVFSRIQRYRVLLGFFRPDLSRAQICSLSPCGQRSSCEGMRRCVVESLCGCLDFG